MPTLAMATRRPEPKATRSPSTESKSVGPLSNASTRTKRESSSASAIVTGADTMSTAPIVTTKHAEQKRIMTIPPLFSGCSRPGVHPDRS